MNHSLLFIPDISGFTQFVSETAVSHSRHVIAELLDVVIESDQLGMTVSEIEGDAVLFHLPDRVPSASELLEQARVTFHAFHGHLKQFERDRICECGACVGATGLTLKFVVHSGPIETIHVRGFDKPFGPDVILAHRLLKNDEHTDEYVLLTDACAPQDGESLPDWAIMDHGRASYDGVGEVDYVCAPLTALRDTVPDPAPRPEPWRMSDPVRMTAHLDLPLPQAFELVSNFDYRLRWNRGVDTLEYEEDRVNRVGTAHRCVINGNVIDFETTTADMGAGRVVYGERLVGKVPVDDPTVYYILEEADGGTRVTAEVHYRPRGRLGFLLAFVFRIAMKRSIRGGLIALEEAARDFPPAPASNA